MQKTAVKTTAMVMVLSILSACGGDPSGVGGGLFASRSKPVGPDEFAILPTKPLELPNEFTALPEPKLGATNLADPQPESDAVAALGGNPERCR